MALVAHAFARGGMKGGFNALERNQPASAGLTPPRSQPVVPASYRPPGDSETDRTSRRRARVVYWANGGGLSRSARIVSEALASAGWEVELVEDVRFPTSTHRPARAIHQVRRWLRHGLEGVVRAAAVRCGRIDQADLNIFLEHLVPSQFHLAKSNVWIPNQEWMLFRWRPHLPRLDGIWVKTHYAERIFSALSPSVTSVGFSSFDRYAPAVVKEPKTFLHVAGRSRQKGTSALLEAWRRNPGWPRRVVIQNPERAQIVTLPNVEYRPIRLDDEELRLLQNRSEFHLYPSEAEGFGHVLCESMGLGGIVMTTDAPPMNELVANDRGLLVSYDRTSPQGLGTNYYAAVSSIEAAVERMLQMSDQEKQVLRDNARLWFRENHATFTQALQRIATHAVEKRRP
ncbi:MAG: glycosyltransferase [Planctomycetota bacterium]|nr:MAG: glycosyltransferase [Planctomycetota bacterium]